MRLTINNPDFEDVHVKDQAEADTILAERGWKAQEWKKNGKRPARSVIFEEYESIRIDPRDDARTPWKDRGSQAAERVVGIARLRENQK